MRSTSGWLAAALMGVMLSACSTGAPPVAISGDPKASAGALAAVPATGPPTAPPTAPDPGTTTPPVTPTTPPVGTDGAPAPSRTTGPVSVFELEVGQCFEESTVEGQFSEVTLVNCDEPHLAEVFALLDHPAAPGEAYPGQDAVSSFASDECVARFEPYVGQTYELSAIFFTSFTPTEGSWEQGDREIVCLLVGDQNADGSRNPLVGSKYQSGE